MGSFESMIDRVGEFSDALPSTGESGVIRARWFAGESSSAGMGVKGSGRVSQRGVAHDRDSIPRWLIEPSCACLTTIVANRFPRHSLVALAPAHPLNGGRESKRKSRIDRKVERATSVHGQRNRAVGHPFNPCDVGLGLLSCFQYR